MKPSAYDANSEALLIRSVMAHPTSDGTLRALRMAQPHWFLVPLYRTLWTCIQDAQTEFGSLDWVGLLMVLRRSGASDAIQTRAEAFLNEPFPDFHGRPDHALAQVREAWLRRESTARLAKLQASMGDMTLDLETLMGEVHEAFEAVTVGESEDLVSSDFSVEVGRWMEGLPVHERVERARLVRFGLPDLDSELISGPGSLGVIAAKTSAGKTAAEIQALLFTLRAGFRPMVVSLEADDEELGTRLIACASQLAASDIAYRGGSMEGSQWANPMDEARKIRKIAKVPCRHFDVLASAIRREVRRHAIDVVFVDYFTLISPPDTGGKQASTAYRLGEMSKGFKSLATELGIAVVILSQFNREVKDGERPQLEHLRETGQLEQDASWVLFLWTDQARYEAGEVRTVNLELAKNRGGKRWVKALATFDPSRQLFTPTHRTTASTKPAPAGRVQPLRAACEAAR